MKIPFIIYAQALGIYMVLSLPALFEPAIYLISATYAFCTGFVAMIAFAAVFLVLHLIKASAGIATAVLFLSIVIAVMMAYAVLLRIEMPRRSFWYVDEFTFFPVAAIVSGWVATGINYRKIAAHFSPAAIEEFETIFSS